MRHTILALLALPLAADEAKTITTPSGLKLEQLAEGKPGTAPKPGDRVRFHYVLSLADGKKLEDTRAGGQPFGFVVGSGMVIDGWEEGLPHMDAGSKWKLIVPAALAFGDAGNVRAGIAPGADVVFEIEVLDVMKGLPPPDFRPGDPAKQKATESGVKWEALEEGSGPLLQGPDVIEMRCTIWTADGKVVFTPGAGRIAGEVGLVRLSPGGERFLAESLVHMRPGGRYRLEVPPAACWGEAKVLRRLDKNAPTVWQIDVLRTIRFVPLDPAKTRKTASGLEVEVVEEGAGRAPGPASRIVARYTGWLEDGTEFWSAHRAGKPETFRMDQVIKGWQEGLQLMKEGSVYRFRIPTALAYADKPPMAKIPPNANLIFEVELIYTE